MIRPSLLLLAAAAALPAAAEEPAADWRVEAFRATCLPHRQDYAALTAHALATGWKEDTGAGHPELAQTLENATVQPEDLKDGMQLTLRGYSRSVDGRFAGLILAHTQSPAIDLVSCYFYDFDAAAAVPQALMDPWLGEPPYEVIGAEQPFSGQQWDTPEKLPGTWDVQNAFIPDGSPYAALTGFTGVLIRITAVDPKDS